MYTQTANSNFIWILESAFWPCAVQCRAIDLANHPMCCPCVSEIEGRDATETSTIQMTVRVYEMPCTLAWKLNGGASGSSDVIPLSWSSRTTGAGAAGVVAQLESKVHRSVTIVTCKMVADVECRNIATYKASNKHTPPIPSISGREMIESYLHTSKGQNTSKNKAKKYDICHLLVIV